MFTTFPKPSDSETKINHAFHTKGEDFPPRILVVSMFTFYRSKKKKKKKKNRISDIKAIFQPKVLNSLK